MGEIVESVERVTAIMSLISSASGEQEQNIGLVQQAVSEMNATTQQNAALVEQAAAAASSLRQQAAQLAEVVSTFRLDNPAGRAIANEGSHARQRIAHRAAAAR